MKKNFRWILLALAVITYLAGKSAGFGSIAFVVMLITTLALAFLYYYPVACYIMAMRAFSEGNNEGAIKHIKNSTKGPFASKENLVSYAYFIMREGNCDDARKILEGVIADDKADSALKLGAKQNLAILYSKTDEMDKALDLIGEVFCEMKNTNTYGTYGYFLILSGKLEEALNINLEAFDYNPSNTTIRDNLGLNYYMLGEYEKAEEIYDSLIADNPTFIDAYYNAANTKEKLGKTDEAIELYKKAKTIRPSFLSNVTHEEIEQKIKEVEE